MSKVKQAQMVLDYMQEHGSIDQWRAMNDLRILRLGARIYDLKASGVPIMTVRKSKKNEDGTYTSWAEYSLVS